MVYSKTSCYCWQLYFRMTNKKIIQNIVRYRPTCFVLKSSKTCFIINIHLLLLFIFSKDNKTKRERGSSLWWSFVIFKILTFFFLFNLFKIDYQNGDDDSFSVLLLLFFLIYMYTFYLTISCFTKTYAAQGNSLRIPVNLIQLGDSVQAKNKSYLRLENTILVYKFMYAIVQPSFWLLMTT